MHGILTTPTFERQARRAGLTEDDVMAMCVWLAENPLSGGMIPGSGGARKVRFAGRGKGKSGGYRTVHYFAVDDVPLFLLGLVDKGEAANLTKAERNELAKILPQVGEAYRVGVKRRIKMLRR